ncbi:MAG: hypothetical protein ACJAS3_000094 [Roseivirga sp.]|jgi:hypothetical protein
MDFEKKRRSRNLGGVEMAFLFQIIGSIISDNDINPFNSLSL